VDCGKKISEPCVNAKQLLASVRSEFDANWLSRVQRQITLIVFEIDLQELTFGVQVRLISLGAFEFLAYRTVFLRENNENV
jgi:hypothetical protein